MVPLTKNDLQTISNLLDEKLKTVSSKDDMSSFKDKILAEIKNLRDDVTIVTGYRDMMEDHEVRIEKLEKRTGMSKPQ